MSPSPPRPGDIYEDFHIIRLLGQGAFAWVFEVRTQDSEQPAALKICRHPIGRSKQSERPLREVAILQRLTNSHVVKIYDSGVGQDGRVFILTELLHGHQLDAFHDFDQPMVATTALTMIHQACLGLSEAHNHGIVHRDIKPANLWIEPNQNLKVIDFGLARAWDTVGSIGNEVTLGRFLVGTPHYMQPEQLHRRKLTPASDVYSLTLILYELLTGYTPLFPDELPSAVKARLADDPIPWIEAHARHPIVPLRHYPRNRDLPDDLVQLIESNLTKQPDTRLPDAGRLSLRLSQILHYHYGLMTGATLRITHAYGGYEEQLLLPGSHRIGSASTCEIAVRDPQIRSVHATLDWTGLPAYPTLRPLMIDGSVTVAGAPVERRIQLDPHDHFSVGSFQFELHFPGA